ncbi:hypothetical protein WICPIJ_004107 [Wickerhamomyces pijperi]|uniref:Uncharacterized protein n=1 Tax=Wickerhamomyces pijperi TaxID=599730 RepID=A0A9P8Q8J5_WICPI|nr:hypothetical protein WICPIJ_004107 [Wickerhamomyces pijperi]
MLVPLANSALIGDNSNKDSETKLHGLKLAYRFNSFLICKRPCSGLTAPVPHFGPPTAPNNTASAFLEASKASGVNGTPVASMAAPPIKWCWKLNLMDGRAVEMASKTLMASAVTSVPTWSPGRTTMFFWLTDILYD